MFLREYERFYGFMEEKLTYLDGRIVWKSHAEYNPHCVIHGRPYYYITDVNDVLYLWHFEIDIGDYVLVKKSEDFIAMHEEGLRLDDEIGERRRRQFEAGISCKEIL